MDLNEIFGPNATFKRIVVPCASSRKYVPNGMALLDDDLMSTTRTIDTGTDYVAEYVEKEEKELLELASYYDTNGHSNFDMVSQGTMGLPHEVDQQELTKVYRSYDFTYRPKDNLTITSKKDEIISMIETNSVTVIQGPTGCGKTTQVPQFILDSCYSKKVHCNIIVTQPRRIAAISIANRVSKERNWPVGKLVGYKVGLINSTSQDTRLTYCTTGVLLHRLINTKNLLDYTHIILDEVHERDQDMDFLLLIVRKFLRTNSRTVKVILMSATFQVEKFSKYFSSPVAKKLVPAPIIDVAKQRYYNVATYYLCHLPALGPLPEVSATDPAISKRMMEFCINLVVVLDDLDSRADDVKYDPETGLYERHVILIFLPGIHEIEEIHSLLSLPKHDNAKWDIVVLHSSITHAQQSMIFQKPPKGYRRIILSTNVAESSITVPDVKYVIDFCLTKQLITDPITNFQCLQLTWASKTNCEQRAGRAGRVMDGRVYRLVPQKFYEKILPQEGAPEMLRAPLENLVLKAKLLDIGEPKAVLALSLDPPDLGNLGRTILLLKEAGALLNKPHDQEYLDGQLTDLGRIMANLPLDIHVTKLIMLGHNFSILKDTIVIAACMAVKDMFSNPFKQKLLAYQSRLKWAADSSSDCIAFLNVYQVWMNNKANRRINSDEDEKKWAARSFVQIRVLREVKALATELTDRLERLGVRESAGVQRVVWPDSQRPFILKIVIAGAFYPNYFMKRTVEGKVAEKEGVKLLGGLDPCNTVYVQGWPTTQPGPLYARRIKEIFKDCLTTPTGKINVFFDASTRVYIQFDEDSRFKNNDYARIPQSVRNAIRMRQSNIPIEIPVLSDENANRRASELNLQKQPLLTAQKRETHEESQKSGIRPLLPGLHVSRIPIAIHKVRNPGHFWVHVRSREIKNREEQIKLYLDAMKESLEAFTEQPEIGTLVIAPFMKNNTVVYRRATVKGYSENMGSFVKVFCVDYGHTNDVQISDLRKLDNDEIAEIPALALECVLANIRPSGAHELVENWPKASFECFYPLIHKPGALYGEIFSVVNSVVALDLIYSDEQGEINIGQSLIDQNFAIHKEEDYFSRFNHDLRLKHSEMSVEQRRHYEKLQYHQNSMSDTYPEPPGPDECRKFVTLTGPFSPLEVDLVHLTVAGRDKKVRIAMNSVNCVFLDTDPEDLHARLVVAGTVAQNVHGSNLTLYNTTAMPNIPGLMALIVLIFTPHMELRLNSLGTRYVGALCGLGYDPITNRSLYPEHDMELHFDIEITIDDLQYVNRIRHWMNIGLQISQPGDTNNMDDMNICQNRIKDAFTELIKKKREPQEPEILAHFNRWNQYDASLVLEPGRTSIITNGIYKLHNALKLEEVSELQKTVDHLTRLRMLANQEPQKTDNSVIRCDVCEIDINSVYELRGHLYSKQHRQCIESLGI